MRAGQGEVGGRRPRLPDVLADRDADERLPELEEEQLAAGLEVAVLVEDAVVGEEALAVDGPYLSSRADRARVEEVTVEVRSADESGDVSRLGGDLGERPRRSLEEARSKQEVLGRVAGDGELWKEHEVGAGFAGFLEPREDAVTVPVQVADDGVDLRERQPHDTEGSGLRLSVEN